MLKQPTASCWKKRVKTTTQTQTRMWECSNQNDGREGQKIDDDNEIEMQAKDRVSKQTALQVGGGSHRPTTLLRGWSV